MFSLKIIVCREKNSPSKSLCQTTCIRSYWIHLNIWTWFKPTNIDDMHLFKFTYNLNENSTMIMTDKCAYNFVVKWKFNYYNNWKRTKKPPPPSTSTWLIVIIIQYPRVKWFRNLRLFFLMTCIYLICILI